MKKIFDYFRGFSKSQRYRTVSTHPQASQRYAKELREYIQGKDRNVTKSKKSKPTFTLAFSNKFR